MRFTTATIALVAFASAAYAHEEMKEPAPFRSKFNKNVSNPDTSMTEPLKPTGADAPCKGYLVDLGTPQGAPTASWPAGSTQQITLSGGAAHNGGSCQFSLSYDGGKTFKVIKSIMGNCVDPSGNEHSFDVTIPANAKSGDTVFSWSWFNEVGNREMYQNCAAVTITGTGTSTLDDRPDIFLANIGNGCTVPDGGDVRFPNPGPDVEILSEAKLVDPVGTCQAKATTPPAAASPPAAGTEVPPAQGSVIAAPPTATSSAPPVVAPTNAAGAAPPTGIAPPTGVAPPVTGAGGSYTVVAGDICTTIASKNGITVAQLLQNNPSIDAGCTNLTVGQSITLRRRSRIMREYH